MSQEPSLLAPGRGVLLFGSTGLLGSAVAAEGPVKTLRWHEVRELGKEALEARIRGLFRPDEAFDVVIACGLTDPLAPRSELLDSNVRFPRRVTEALASWSDARVLTLGTVFENFDESVRTNAYTWSKRELRDWMRARPASGFIHLQLHTVFGPRLNSRMFLGQMMSSLRAGQRFAMTSGEQLREYHHSRDIASAIRSILAHSWPGPVVTELSSGRPIRLVELARAVFEAAGRPDLLDAGALPRPCGENLERVFERSPRWVLPKVEDPIRELRSMVATWLAR